MAIGNSNNEYADYKLFFIKVKGLKKGETVNLLVKNAETNEEESLEPPKANLSGLVSKFEKGDYEYEGEKVDTMSIWLRDDQMKETYKLELNFNSLSRNIINALYSLKGNIGVLDFSFYMNKNGRPSVSIQNNGERVSWHKSFTEIKEGGYVTEEKDKKGKISYDNDKYDELVKKWIQELSDAHVTPEVPKEEKKTEENEGRWIEAGRVTVKEGVEEETEGIVDAPDWLKD